MGEGREGRRGEGRKREGRGKQGEARKSKRRQGKAREGTGREGIVFISGKQGKHSLEASLVLPSLSQCLLSLYKPVSYIITHSYLLLLCNELICLLCNTLRLIQPHSMQNRTWEPSRGQIGGISVASSGVPFWLQWNFLYLPCGEVWNSLPLVESMEFHAVFYLLFPLGHALLCLT